MAKKSKLVLVDTMAIIHRAYHAYPGLTTSDGTLINAVYGFGIMFFQILKNLKPDYVVFASDLKEKTFRNEKYVDYKANRSPADEGLVTQFELVYEFIHSTGFPLFTQEGFEADDILGSLARKYSKDYDVCIVTGDKDLLQLLDENICVTLPGKTFSDMRIYTPKEFIERFGFEPEKYIDFKALVGDTSDNIKGAKGIGEKTATDLIKSYSSIDGIFKNIDQIKERYQKILNEYKNTLYNNLEIVEIHKKLDFDVDVKKADVKNLDANETIKFLKKYEFNSLIGQFKKLELGAKDEVEEIVEDKKLVEFKEVDKDLKFVLPYENKFILFNENYEYKLSTDIPDNAVVYSAKTIYRAVGTSTNSDDLFSENASNGQSWEDLKIKDDLELMAYCYDPAVGGKEVEQLFKLLFHKDVDSVYEVNNKKIDKEILPKVLAFIDSHKKVTEGLTGKQKELYEQIELPLTPILFKMESLGIKVNPKYLKDLEGTFNKKIEELKSKLFECVGHEFNPNSTKELAHILYEELKLPTQKKNKTGFSTDERSIGKLLGVHPIIELILEYREFTKLQSTYVIGLQKLIENERIHTEFRQTVVATGRLSSINPNLQNIPIRSETGMLIRKAFVADKGKVLLSMDYSQIELRLMAHISGDKEFIKAFKDGKDIHTNTASLMFNVPEDKVSQEQRRVAKMINFGIIYGISDFGLSDRLGGEIDVKQAKEFIKKYFERYPKVKEYFDKIKVQIEEDGYVETIFGRRRYFNVSAGNYMVKQAMFREAINMPIQGADADIVKLAMIKVQDLIDKKYGDKVKVLLQIHDELLFEIEDDEKFIKNFVSEAEDIMENVVKLEVPLIVNSKTGKNWGDMER